MSDKDIVIKAENISKMYDLGLVGTGTLSKDLNRTWAKLRGKPDPYAQLAEVNDRTQQTNTKKGSVWALKDINFEVEKGEVLGIIGKNGAGKSTLLKILSQITTPTTGDIKIKGRVASLLEVGTGMHPEMTARQNIYLNGSLMGMTRKEVTQKLDEIVDFAGIGKYIDTPTKRFSSGMTVRLGFAVAAFLEPEILIVDEVLAVGDAEFQKKAVGKMQDVSKGEGRTVLFVSHNMASVKSLCSKAVILEKGNLVAEGSADDMVKEYLSGGGLLKNNNEWNYEVKSDVFELYKVKLEASGHNQTIVLNQDDEINVVIHYSLKDDTERYDFNLKFKSDDGVNLLNAATFETKNGIDSNSKKCVMTIPSNYFNQGNYIVDLRVVKNKKKMVINSLDAFNLNISPKKQAFGEWMGKSSVYLYPNFKWNYS